MSAKVRLRMTARVESASTSRNAAESSAPASAMRVRDLAKEGNAIERSIIAGIEQCGRVGRRLQRDVERTDAAGSVLSF